MEMITKTFPNNINLKRRKQPLFFHIIISCLSKHWGMQPLGHNGRYGGWIAVLYGLFQKHFQTDNKLLQLYHDKMPG